MARYLLIFFVLIGLRPNICWGLEVDDILDRVQRRYAGDDFEADFDQESHLKAMGMADTAEGHIYFRRPGMMRWHYKNPEEYFIISNGDTVWIYRPEDNQVLQGRAVDYFGSKKGADFFTNQKELSRQFIVGLAPREFESKDHYVLRLVPRTDRPGLAQLYLYVSKENFEIVQATTYNHFGDATILKFHGYKFGGSLDSSLFVFDIPSGAEVIRLNGEQEGEQP